MARVVFTGYPDGHPGHGQAGSWTGAGIFLPGEVKIVPDDLADEMLRSGVFDRAPKDAEVGPPARAPKVPRPSKDQLESTPTEFAAPEAALDVPVAADAGPAAEEA